VIAREQSLLVGQLYLVEAAVELFEEVVAAHQVHAFRSEMWHSAQARLDVVGRAFVYEAATLRALAVDIGKRFPQFADDARRAVADYDDALPTLVALRNSQAHLDERLNFRARGKSISTRSLEYDPHGFGSMTPPQVCGLTVQGTTEDGRHAIVAVDGRAVDAAHRLVQTVFASVRPRT
jgi:hypothetical protein